MKFLEKGKREITRRPGEIAPSIVLQTKESKDEYPWDPHKGTKQGIPKTENANHLAILLALFTYYIKRLPQ